MQTQKLLNILSKSPITKKTTSGEIVKLLLKNRNITSEAEIASFLHPKLENLTSSNVGIDKKQLAKAVKRINFALSQKENIVVYGDYDVDGITGTAILWETLYRKSKNVTPYIPHRIDEGYGLSIKGIDNLLSENKETKLIITVDNGIVAQDAVEYANKKGIDVIITDHHVPDTNAFMLPKAHAIVHTTMICGAGVAYLLSKEFNDNENLKEHLELAALGTIADLVPLQGANRIIVKLGLKELQHTSRLGLLALFKEAGIKTESIGVYEVGHMIAPRLNAMGRLENAMDSLRLLCTNDQNRANTLAQTVSQINKERQDLTKSAIAHAKAKVSNLHISKKILIISDQSYQQGIIGLVAGRLVEEFYLPSIVIAIGEKESKASARSVKGFDIVSFIRTAKEYLIDVGGHPMAAGFTVETAKIGDLSAFLEKNAIEAITTAHTIRSLTVDAEIPFSLLTKQLFDALQQLSPFGMGNPEPVFVSYAATVVDVKYVGTERQHIKLQLKSNDSEVIEAIGFGMTELASDLQRGDSVSIVFTLSENTWNSKISLQLKLKDIQLT